MNIPHLPILLTCAVTVVCPLQADYTAAGQEVSAAIDAFSTSLREINALLQGVQDRSTADAATNPLRTKTREMYLSMRRVKEISLTAEPSDEDQALLTRQVLEVQLLQAEFEQHCTRLVGHQFYESASLARLFQVIADMYRREQMGETVAPAAAPQQPAEKTIDEEERRRREDKRNERLKRYRSK